MKSEKVISEEEMEIEKEQAIIKKQDIQFELIRFYFFRHCVKKLGYKLEIRVSGILQQH